MFWKAIGSLRVRSFKRIQKFALAQNHMWFCDFLKLKSRVRAWESAEWNYPRL